MKLKELTTFLSIKLKDILHPVFFITLFSYVILAKIMLLFFPDMTKIIVVYPSLGLGIAILLIYGIRFWPAIFLGSLIASFIQGSSFLFYFLITILTFLEILFEIVFLTVKNKFDYSLRT